MTEQAKLKTKEKIVVVLNGKKIPQGLFARILYRLMGK